MSNSRPSHGTLGLPVKHYATHAWLWFFLVLAVASIMFILRSKMKDIAFKPALLPASHFTNHAGYVEEPSTNDGGARIVHYQTMTRSITTQDYSTAPNIFTKTDPMWTATSNILSSTGDE